MPRKNATHSLPNRIRLAKEVIHPMPGMDWKDPKPMVLPEIPGVEKFEQIEGSAGVPARNGFKAGEDARAPQSQDRAKRG